MTTLYQAIIWDLDGTLIQTKEHIRNIDFTILKMLGYPQPTLEHYYANPHKVDWLKYYEYLGLTPKDQKKADKMFYEIENDILEIEKIEGAEEIIQLSLERRLINHILSNNASFKNVYNKIRKSGLDRYFTLEMVTSCSGSKTPHLTELCHRYDVESGRTLFVTDTAKDIIDGKAAGVVTVGISNEHSFDNFQEIHKADPYHLFVDVRELKLLLMAR
jgi:phosphoglycolate phosphatase-like HAD superfamily hydrolase